LKLTREINRKVQSTIRSYMKICANSVCDIGIVDTKRVVTFIIDIFIDNRVILVISFLVLN